jgi:alpha-L-fucosidase
LGYFAIDYFVKLKKRMKKITFCYLFVLTHAAIVAQNLPKPHPRQLAWQQMETIAFVHFTVNTFTDKEWGEGTESPQIFNPTKLDVNQWTKTLKQAGFKQVIITAKHHDGFCLWPSKFTEHSIKNSPYKNGKGDIVKELADACKKDGLKLGVYLSPWDRHEPSYGTDAYNTHYKNQLRELLTNYGEISEVWFDGAKGENAKNMEYDFDGYWKMVRELQPNAVIFSDAGPDVRWVGNETGNAGETCWSMIDGNKTTIGKADTRYLNTGDRNGKDWIPAETDVSIRKGWFYHESENSSVKTPKELVELYYKSVGRNSLLLLNIPPNREGLFEATDVASILAFRKILNATFRNNLVVKSKKTSLLVDKNEKTHLETAVNEPIEIDITKNKPFDRILLQEDISQGQRLEEALLEYFDGINWQKINQITTVGYKRLVRFPMITGSKIRLTVLKARGKVLLSEMGVFKADVRE